MKVAENKQDPASEFKETQEIEVEVTPEFSVETISPIPAEKTPSQMDPKQVQRTKEIKLKEQRKTQEVKTNQEK